jgi:hypothetical protein
MSKLDNDARKIASGGATRAKRPAPVVPKRPRADPFHRPSPHAPFGAGVEWYERARKAAEGASYEAMHGIVISRLRHAPSYAAAAVAYQAQHEAHERARIAHKVAVEIGQEVLRDLKRAHEEHHRGLSIQYGASENWPQAAQARWEQDDRMIRSLQTYLGRHRTLIKSHADDARGSAEEAKKAQVMADLNASLEPGVEIVSLGRP